MRALLGSVFLIVASGCQGILGIPSEGQIGCPEPCKVTVSGRTVRAESTAAQQLPLSGVTVRLTSVDPPQEMVTGADGTYSFTGLDPGTALNFELSFPQTDPNPGDLLHTLYEAGTTGESNIMLDLPVVQFRWLAEVAFQCGIFPTLNDALFEPTTTDVNSYFLTRATIVGLVLDEDGTAARLDRGDISAQVQDFLNYHQNLSDTANPPPTTVCFLEPGSAGAFQGVNAPSSEGGRFVMFRARNNVGTGSGVGEVRIPEFPIGPLSVSSGTIGFVRIRVGEGENLPARPRTFERDIYRFFDEKTCSDVCHRPPDGIGFTTAPAREGPGGMLYPADWSAPVDMVYDNLTKPFATDCQLGGAMAARVCLAQPDASLLYRKPAGLTEPIHAGVVLGTEDEMVVNILRWIEDGAVLR